MHDKFPHEEDISDEEFHAFQKQFLARLKKSAKEKKPKPSPAKKQKK